MSEERRKHNSWLVQFYCFSLFSFDVYIIKPQQWEFFFMLEKFPTKISEHFAELEKFICWIWIFVYPTFFYLYHCWVFLDLFSIRSWAHLQTPRETVKSQHEESTQINKNNNKRARKLKDTTSAIKGKTDYIFIQSDIMNRSISAAYN